MCYTPHVLAITVSCMEFLLAQGALVGMHICMAVCSTSMLICRQGQSLWCAKVYLAFFRLEAALPQLFEAVQDSQPVLELLL